MEERNLELDDDGKIKIKKTTQVLPDGEGSTDVSVDDIVINLPEFKGFGEETEDTVSDEELVRRSEERERERANRKALAERMYEEAEALFAKGELDAAGEKFLDSASLNGGDWRAWFGVVRVQTKDLTEFSAIYDCEQAYDKAFRRMSAEDRRGLAEKYVERLRARAEVCAKEHERLSAEDARLREEQRPAIGRHYQRTMAVFVCVLLFFIGFVVAGGIFAGQVYNYEGSTFLVLSIVSFAFALGLFVILAVYAKRLVLARIARTKNARAGTTEAGEQARVYAEEEELLLSIIEDMTK